MNMLVEDFVWNKFLRFFFKRSFGLGFVLIVFWRSEILGRMDIEFGG